MKGFIFMALLCTMLLSCNPVIDSYKTIVCQADIFSIYYADINKSFQVPDSSITHFKKVLTRNIYILDPVKFPAQTRIELFRGGVRTGALIINDSLVNFESDGLHFTFGLTYGIGMWIGNR